ncbi:MAG: hypothetical protein A2Z47_13915 [Thermodesulfovibrio sp. RBG_19FT_COMBO_42_12]|nr:MAG: hypothetical protein A2Z47_13915 [Thermodesulfovibrio sp. RBG_19FT_COMBO_42_12]
MKFPPYPIIKTGAIALRLNPTRPHPQKEFYLTKILNYYESYICYNNLPIVYIHYNKSVKVHYEEGILPQAG